MNKILLIIISFYIGLGAIDYGMDINKQIKLADSGDKFAQYNVSVIYDFGLGVHIDNDKAIEYLIKSANSGYDKAQYLLALEYLSGKKVLKNYKKAEELFILASKQNNQFAQLELGKYYRDSNIDTSIKFLKLSVSQKNIEAQILLAHIYCESSKFQLCSNIVQQLYYYDRVVSINIWNQYKLYKYIDYTK